VVDVGFVVGVAVEVDTVDLDGAVVARRVLLTQSRTGKERRRLPDIGRPDHGRHDLEGDHLAHDAAHHGTGARDRPRTGPVSG
jgi:hypothetical protein